MSSLFPTFDEGFDRQFRDWRGGGKAIVVRRDLAAHAADPFGRFARLHAPFPAKDKLRTRDAADPGTRGASPLLPVRPWIDPKDACPPIGELRLLWARRGYRPLTLHETADFLEAYRDASGIGLEPFPYPFIHAGIDATFARDAGPGRVVMLGSWLSNDGAFVPRMEWEDMAYFSDVLFLLTPVQAVDAELARPEDVPPGRPYLVRAPDRWDLVPQRDPLAGLF